MQYKRESSERILNLAKFFPAVVITGARQTGKTTLLRNLFSHYNYVSLDLPSLAAEANDDPESFLAKYPAPVVIDEVQYAPGLFRHLKIVIDRHPERKGLFILTGSQKFTLMKSISDSLAGRVGLIELEGLSSEELGDSLKKFLHDKSPAQLLARGFFPQLWKEPEFPSYEFYQSYIATYLERDVRQILNVTSLRDFERFMRACAIRSGQILNKSELAKDVGIHHKSANDWLSVLQASNQIVLLEPYFSNETKRIVKSPKLYFSDTGLLCALLGLNETQIDNYANIGAIWETFLFSRFRKHNHNYARQTGLWFYRDQSGIEVDFLLEHGGKLSLVEAKWTQYPDRKCLSPMISLQNKLPNIDKMYIACRTDSKYPLGPGYVLNGIFDLPSTAE